MKRFLLTAAFTALAAPVLAEPACTPGETLKPVWESLKSFEDEGGKVLAFKINDGGCYEIYGTLNGTKMEVFFDPNTGTELDRIAD
ncbi:PepSY domain-containing protein [Pseudorhodobacter sp. E13]|uniref:PepSY domain-containing protein n=1 Tax=Pseudorhodobacter sp. E13 TaxID=2487931 RepID=UPI000F8D9F8F|nr:PepSY domain-containing protein [Pseudorhodobacter sp. E13]RUS60562.1 PepSY domain-containing protein [Pseudorhodobacter sp. E13]